MRSLPLWIFHRQCASGGKRGVVLLVVIAVAACENGWFGSVGKHHVPKYLAKTVGAVVDDGVAGKCLSVFADNERPVEKLHFVFIGVVPAAVGVDDAAVWLDGCVGNVGPTLGTEIGPTMSWSELPDVAKW